MFATLVLGLGLMDRCAADIYGYTAADGSLYLSDYPIDPRYALILKEPAAPIPPQAMDAQVPGNGVKPSPAASYSRLVEETAQQQQLEAQLLHAVIATESAYNPQALSPKGAAGLMQLMPATAKRYGVTDIYDPTQNVRAGARHLKELLHLFGNDLRLSLAAYNAGEQAVLRHGRRIPPYLETQNYVAKVLDIYRGIQRPPR